MSRLHSDERANVSVRPSIRLFGCPSDVTSELTVCPVCYSNVLPHKDVGLPHHKWKIYSKNIFSYGY